MKFIAVLIVATAFAFAGWQFLVSSYKSSALVAVHPSKTEQQLQQQLRTLK